MTQCTASTSGTLFFKYAMKPLWRPVIAGAPSVAIDIIFFRGICFSSQNFSSVLNIVSPFVFVSKFLANNSSRHIFSFFINLTYDNNNASLVSKVDSSNWIENWQVFKWLHNNSSIFSAISSIRLCTELLLKEIFRIISAAGLWSTVVITSFIAGKIKSSPMVCGLPV